MGCSHQQINRHPTGRREVGGVLGRMRLRLRLKFGPESQNASASSADETRDLQLQIGGVDSEPLLSHVAFGTLVGERQTGERITTQRELWGTDEEEETVCDRSAASH